MLFFIGEPVSLLSQRDEITPLGFVHGAHRQADRHTLVCLSLVVEPISMGSNPTGLKSQQKNLSQREVS